MGKKGAPLRCLSIANMNKKSLLWLLPVLVAGCAHQPPFTPSQGHIDSNQAEKAAIAPGNIPKPVKSAAYLPPPKPKAKEQTYSVVVNDVPVREILFALARESKLNVDIHPGIVGNVTLNAVDQTLPAILERISKQIDMIYKFEGGVVTISPDKPVLKTYQINYVNMNRDTKGSVGVSQEIASAGVSETGSASSSSKTESGANMSMTTVETISKNQFWDTLIQNIKDILAESDKEVLVNRLGSDARLQAQYDAVGRGTGSLAVNTPGAPAPASQGGQGVPGQPGGVAGTGNQSVQGNANESAESNLKSYKTLFAASVIANRETGVLSIRATERQHEKIRDFVDMVQASAKRQVLIEATIVEITLNDKFQAGIDWSRLGSDGTLKGFTFKQELLGTALTAAPRFVLGYNNTKSPLGDLAASIRLLNTFGNTKVLSSPKLMVMNSQTAILKVVDNLVYFTARSQISQGSAGSSTVTTTTTTPHTVPIGVWMSVTPQINENGIVTLNVRPTISRISGSVRDPNPNLVVESNIPQVQIREMESLLQVSSGNTVILGGLMQDDISKTDDTVPGISKIPLLGKLFGAKNDRATKTELVIFLKPTVVTNASIDGDFKAFKQFLPDQLPAVTTDESVN